MNKALFLLLIVILTSCTLYNDPSDYEVSETVFEEKNGNQLIRCFSHINAFVDKKDWYYAVKDDDNFEYYKLENVDEKKLLFIKNFKRNRAN